MQTLYKYSGDLGASFIDNPTIKLSLPSRLNDPFEKSLSADIKKYLLGCFKNPDSESSKNILEITEMLLNFICIVSLSETHRNSLMWAHYANEHAGMCLGIDSTYLEHKKSVTLPAGNDKVGIIGQHIPKKMNYDNVRFDMDGHDLIPHHEFGSVAGYQKFLFKQLSLKSDEWIYEKEHRSIVPINYADAVIIKRKGRPVFLDEFIKRNEESGAMESLGYERYKILANDCFKHLAAIHHTFEKDRLSFICKIPAKKIKSLYLGVNYNKENQDKILDKLCKNNHPLKHIKIYKKEVDESRFEFNSTLIYSPDTI
ncbi:DUF2971 domain-containing protein [Aeromonas rivipollensis]|uniref:DUF2971 domain-containing protein n=1 Tax=Aeromonas rivipollensis TaxID=948519 RepID=UPI0026F04344|nr:DUF2971 domain-containing protein [Aeromonas media]